MEFFTKTSEETREAGEKVAKRLKGGEILALVGELGAGKTTFIQGLAHGLKITQKVISPTFILMRQYKIKIFNNLKIRKLYHLDLYRLEGKVESEVRSLGIEDIWKNPKNIVVVEWADKLTGFFPKNTIWITFENIGENKRKITVK